MFEIVLLIVSATGIGAYARGRGGNPIVWGTLGIGGYVVIAYLGPVLMASFGRPVDPDSGIWLTLVGVAWVGIVAFSCSLPAWTNSRKTIRDVVLPQLQIPQSTVRRHLRGLPTALR